MEAPKSPWRYSHGKSPKFGMSPRRPRRPRRPQESLRPVISQSQNEQQFVSSKSSQKQQVVAQHHAAPRPRPPLKRTESSSTCSSAEVISVARARLQQEYRSRRSLSADAKETSGSSRNGQQWRRACIFCQGGRRDQCPGGQRRCSQRGRGRLGRWCWGCAQRQWGPREHKCLCITPYLILWTLDRVVEQYVLSNSIVITHELLDTLQLSCLSDRRQIQVAPWGDSRTTVAAFFSLL